MIKWWVLPILTQRYFICLFLNNLRIGKSVPCGYVCDVNKDATQFFGN